MLHRCALRIMSPPCRVLRCLWRYCLFHSLLIVEVLCHRRPMCGLCYNHEHILNLLSINFVSANVGLANGRMSFSLMTPSYAIIVPFTDFSPISSAARLRSVVS
ncbi:hypothetical protein M405DRAFT_935558 [Rhizopogon salebrosus TDB-379]|nr:hypothetical protein M405DRAFT_935558 [Rhizopogon salebrosus TDB-379]